MKVRAQYKHREYKKTIDLDESRKLREQITVELRKASRNTQFAKRRMGTMREIIYANDTLDPEHNEEDAKLMQEVQQNIAKIPELAQMVMSDDLARQQEGTTQIRQMLSIGKYPPFHEIVETGVIGRFVQFLQLHHIPQLQFEAAWALTNIASGSSKFTKRVVEAGAPRYFINLLKTPNEDVRDQSIWALGNIAGDCNLYRDMLLKMGTLTILCELCNPKVSNYHTIRHIIWAISNLCRGKPQPPIELVQPALNLIKDLIYTQDEEVVVECCWTLSYLSDDTETQNQRISAVLATNTLRRICELLTKNNTKLRTPALRILGNIVTGEIRHTQAVIDTNIVPFFGNLLYDKSMATRKETCWMISNITAGTSSQIEVVFQAGLIPRLLELLQNDDFEVRKEALWAISNAITNGSMEQVQLLVHKCGIVPILCRLINCPDANLTLNALETIENLLKIGYDLAKKAGSVNVYCHMIEECDGLKAIEAAQEHENKEVYDKALTILTNFFEVDDESSMAPVVSSSGQFQFGQQSAPQSLSFSNFCSSSASFPFRQ